MLTTIADPTPFHSDRPETGVLKSTIFGSETSAATKIQTNYRGHEVRRDQRASSLTASVVLAALKEADHSDAASSIDQISDDGATDTAVRSLNPFVYLQPFGMVLNLITLYVHAALLSFHKATSHA